MALLTIAFQDMFLLLPHGAGALVLLPSTAHSARLKIPGYDPVSLFRHQVNILNSENRVVWGERPTVPPRLGATFVMHMDEAYGCRTHTQSGLVGSKPVPTSLNARVVLSGRDGRFTDEPPRRYPRSGMVQWSIARNGGQHVCRLTDYMEFLLPMGDPFCTVLITSWEPFQQQSFRVPLQQDTMLTFVNGDEAGPAPESRLWQLDEYQVLYDLTRSSCPAPGFPIGDYVAEPDARHRESLLTLFGRRGQIEDPICGGGQGDPPDPPEDPPDPRP